MGSALTLVWVAIKEVVVLAVSPSPSTLEPSTLNTNPSTLNPLHFNPSILEPVFHARVSGSGSKVRVSGSVGSALALVWVAIKEVVVLAVPPSTLQPSRTSLPLNL